MELFYHMSCKMWVEERKGCMKGTFSFNFEVSIVLSANNNKIIVNGRRGNNTDFFRYSSYFIIM